MDHASIWLPQFDGENYAFWSRRMKPCIQAQGFDVWRLVVDGYKEPATSSIDRDGKKIKENYLRARNTIKNGVTQVTHTNIMHCDFAKEMWDKLKTIYEGDAKVKEAKL
jgi:hypothetical protein